METFYYVNRGGSCEIGQFYCDLEQLPYSTWAMDMQEPFILDEEMIEDGD